MIEGLQDVIKADSARATKMDCVASVEEYINKSDWRINANANTGYSAAGLVNNLAGKAIANYWLDKVYTKKEGDAHRNGDYHIHDLDILGAYCCGHDLQRLLQEGFNGVVSRVSSKPPKHFREALGQMANFVGILQSEWAGAQAFSSFDTLLAPYVFFDMMVEGIDERDVKKALLSFVYNLNVPSRWGQCVNSSYKCLRADGKWVSHDELQVGESIYVVDVETGELKLDTVTHVNVFDAPEKMHHYSNEQGFNFDVTPNHRVIYKTGSNPFSIKESAELIGKKSPIYIPISSWNTPTPENFMGNEYNITDELLELITFIMCDGCIVKQEGKTARIEFYKSPNRYGCDRFEELCSILGVEYSVTTDESAKFDGSYCNKYRLMNSDVTKAIVNLLGGDKHKCPEFMKYLSPRQAYIVLDAWVLLDGHFDGCHWKMQADNKEIQEMLAFLTVISGKSVSLTERIIGENKKPTIYTNIHKRGSRACSVSEIDAKTDKVWCPTTNTGTFVCMTDEGYVFLTGNSPFSNVTIDMTVPNHMKFLAPQRGEEPYFVRNYREFCESETDTNNEGWNRLFEEARKRLNDYESDEETLLYSLTYEHFKKEMMIISKMYYEVLSEGDCVGQPFTFPIPTVNITEDFEWDNPEYEFLFENAALYGSTYFQNFIGSQYLRDENGKLTIRDESAYSTDDVRSMCPLTFDTKVIVRSRWDASFKEIGNLYKSMQRGTKYECFYNGEWIPCEVVKVSDQDLYEISVSNNKTYRMGAYHEQPIVRDGVEMTVMAKDIQEGDLLPFNTTKIDSGFIHSSYELGYAVGAYLGDGSVNEDGITYSLDAREKDDETEKMLTKIWEGMGYRVTIVKTANLRTLRIGAGSFDVIKRFIKGKTATNKGISNIVLSQSIEMREGIIDGLIATDGDRNKSRIWTSSETLVEDIINLFNSVGIKAYKSFTDTRDGRLGTAPCNSVSYIANRENYKNKYCTIDGKLYWYVTSVVNKGMYTDGLYCLSTDTPHHLFTLADGLITHNCRLQLDRKALRKRGGGLFGSDAQTGSIGVVTINMARLGYLYKGDLKGLYKRLGQLMDMARSTLDKKRAFVEEMNLRGLYPYTRRYVRTLDTFFSTIGVNGMNEMVRNFTNDEYDITDARGQKMALDILKWMNERMVGYQETGKALWNLEATPAEGTTTRFAREDIKRYPDIIQAGFPDAPYYTNSSQLPVDFSDDVFAVLDLQDDLQKAYTGGTVLHIYNDEDVTAEECKVLLRKVLTNYRLPYVSFTATFSTCPKHGRIPGIHEFCPLCDKELMAKHADEIDPNKA